ncbi:HAD family hydrolase [Tuwongella immobilis]|nr:HAD family hydrolase [Tuwongella immobilis]
MSILLFDIDGTLIRTSGAGKSAMEAALAGVFAVTELRDEVSYSGRTDPAIGLDLLRVHGIDPTDAHNDLLHSAYLQHLPTSLERFGGTVLPGIREVMGLLHGHPDVRLGLLTGNSYHGAQAKLMHFGLWHYFRFGGFGDGRHDRDDVARDALAAAQQYLNGPVDPETVYVIGDTPLDIRCARAIGAKAVAVATGWHPRSELAEHQPDWLFDDFSQASELVALWLGVR